MVTNLTLCPLASVEVGRCGFLPFQLIDEVSLLQRSQPRIKVSCVTQRATDHPSIDGIFSVNGSLNLDSYEVQSTCVPEFKQFLKMRNAFTHKLVYAVNCQVCPHRHRIVRCLTTMVWISLDSWVVWFSKESACKITD